VINLMPPDLKSQIRFAKLNRLALRYLRVMFVVVVVLAVVFGGALYLLREQTNKVASDVTTKQKDIEKISKDFLPKAQDASERLNAIKFVQDSQTKFSVLIADLVKVLPKDTDLETVVLTGDEAKPVQMTVSTKTYDQVLALRKALAEKSTRIANADVVNIVQVQGGWTGTLVIGFKPGMAK
jgi:Tfp pilus assembly protein PilN